MSGNIKVVVRCRPLNAREKARGATPLIHMDGNQTFISKPSSKDNKAFTFDKSYWSADKNDDHYADQELVYNDLGRELLDHAFDGYNCCIFAYGQTGSGKSYTMMGYGEDKGIIPHTCLELFERVNDLSTDSLKFQVEVSYIEIYNEKVRDLLNPANKGNLKVREHPTIGPYVEDLSRLVVNSFEDIDHLMNEGNKARTVAATNMNETSSRSHAVFTIFLTSNRYEQVANLNTEKASRISLVDLAGSERANSTGATGVRLKEGANINKSLTTLGKVIAALAEQSSHKKSSANFIPYRDSVLTWLLKDSLGGNSKTAMIAAISPADYDETMSTLRYADQAKRIKNKAIVNEDPNARLIRELKEELQALRDTLMIYAPEEVDKIKKSKGTHSRTSSRATASPMLLLSPESPIAAKRGNSLLTKEQIVEQLQSSEKLLSQVNQTWEEKMRQTEAIHREREKALIELGVIVEKDNMGVYAPRSIHLINLNEDPLMTECLMYHIKPGITKVGRLGSNVPADIKLSGAEIANEHCYFENIHTKEDDENVVTIHPINDAVTLVNGTRIAEPKVLHSGYRIIFGSQLHHLFRFNNPDQVRREREHLIQQGIAPSISSSLFSPTTDSAIGVSPTSVTSSIDHVADWDFAHAEALRKFGGPRNTDLTVMTDEDLKQLSDGITKVREFRNRKRISSDSHNILYDEPEGINVSPRTSVSSSSNKRFSTLSLAPTIVTETEEDEDEKTGLTKEEKDELIRLATEEIQQQLDKQKQDYEEKIKQIESSNLRTDELNKERDDLAAKYAQVKQEMEHTLQQQRLAYENKIKRISAHLPPGTSLSSEDLLREGLTASKNLMRMTIDKWRQLRYVKMAEGCLVHAIVLKEANIMARELGKNVVYQFVVVHDNISANPLSFWESTSALQPFTREADTHLIKEHKPCLAVQIIDNVHRATYIWSITKLKHRLKRMRRLYDYSEGPLFTSQHFNREDPFYETPCPRFSLVGLARVPLRNLTLQLHADNYVDIYCRNTGKVVGQIRVLVTPIARSVSRRKHLTLPEDPDKLGLFYRKRKQSMHQQEDQQALGDKYLLHIGQQQVFEIRIQELKGINEDDFTQVHAQFRLSSFGNVDRYSSADKVYQTDPISNFGNGTVVFGQCQTLSVNITESMMDVILNQGLTIEVYGQAQDNYLFGLAEHNDDNVICSSPTTAEPQPQKSQLLEKMANKRAAIERRFSVEQRTYDGILMEERHDILAWIQICELNSDGQYAPVQVIHTETSDPHHPHVKQHQDTFYLRQGLQRRIALTLTHDSGKQFEWSEVQHVKIGRAKLVDNKGKVIETSDHPPVDIHLFPDPNAVTLTRSGIGRINVQGPWDSSLHECLFLNRVTTSGQHVRLTLSWEVLCDKFSGPITFHMDVAVQIQGRGATMTTSPSSSSVFRQFLLGGGGGDSNGSTEKTVYKATGMFVVYLKPPMTRQVKELWRLNTANKYVRGEEFIGSWKPRGVSLVTDYREARKRMIHRESVAAFRHALVLYRHPQTKAIQRHPSDQNGFYNNQENDEEEEEKPALVQYDPETLVKKVLDLWTTKFGEQDEVEISQDPPEVTSVTRSVSANNLIRKKLYAKMNLIPEIQHLHPSDTVTKRGFLLYPENVHETWIKRWFVLRRPFIIMYEDQSETEELGIINLTSARVDYKSDLEEMIQKSYTFAIYTSNNAYLLQANNFDDMKDWISKIDQFYPVKTLENTKKTT